ncbi:MAG: twin-arginine translocase TatA/TatE family subunit [Flavobacteriales bacterium]|jgi:Sec-independent protein translocase protein TatA|nr:twin-arginine translocase TatA/TatE family subunit [Flavobacteriales bacterium]|tara:strand:+ start:229 stop:408 length:180 start_codon:yes stop_codon:yes gene_type:complete
MKLLLLNLGFGEIFLIALIYLMFFGSKNLPNLMKDLGRFFYKIKRSVTDVYEEFDDDND